MLAPCKINLSLHVVGRRLDGYHLLDGVSMFASVGDQLSVKLERGIKLNIGGPFGHMLSPKDDQNLVLRAARLLQPYQKTPQGAHISLTKNVPVSSGIGGGSSDAAMTLLQLNQLWHTGLNLGQLMGLGLQLGADVPMCLYHKACHIAGVGEAITPMPIMPKVFAVLVNPGVAVSTQSIFSRGWKSFEPAPIVPAGGFSSLDMLEEYLLKSRNDLQDYATETAPEIAEVLMMLSQVEGCYFERMSGSGATCFGLFESEDDAKAAAELIRQKQPEWWVVSTVLS